MSGGGFTFLVDIKHSKFRQTKIKSPQPYHLGIGEEEKNWLGKMSETSYWADKIQKPERY